MIINRRAKTIFTASSDVSLAINYLKEHLLKYETEKLLDNIKNVKDIYDYRYTLKQVRDNPQAISLISDLILIAIHNKLRFRKLDCLKVLKILIKNLSDADELKEDIVVKLFEIYKYFIFSDRDSIQWCVSSIIKDKKLGDDAVEWLVSNHLRSTHIVNRLLLYPHFHHQIESWAQQVLSENRLLDRRSEIIAILIEKDIPKDAINDDLSILQWAIFKCLIPDADKIILLKRYSDINSMQATIEIADRLNSPEILYSLLAKLEAVDIS
jgi:hypothetical protein